MEVSRPVPWIVALALAGCGGSITGQGTDASADHATDAAKDVVESSWPCPASPPTDGTACNLADGFQCEYGSSFWAYCDEMATCTGGAWQLAATQSCPFSENGSSCPAQMPTSGVTCSPESITCGYPTGQCNCEGFCGGAFNPDAGVDWKCATPDPSCPWPRPRFGSACSGTANCSYDICCSGSNMQCQNGYWQGSTSIGGCP